MRNIKTFKLFENVQSLLLDAKEILIELVDSELFKIKYEILSRNEIQIVISNLDDTTGELLGGDFIKYEQVYTYILHLIEHLTDNNYFFDEILIVTDSSYSEISYENFLEITPEAFNSLDVYSILLLFYLD